MICGCGVISSTYSNIFDYRYLNMDNPNTNNSKYKQKSSGQARRPFSCSNPLNMTFILLINVKMRTIVGGNTAYESFKTTQNCILCSVGITCSVMCLTVSLSLSHWYPGSGLVLDCIDSDICTLIYFAICFHVRFLLLWYSVLSTVESLTFLYLL